MHDGDIDYARYTLRELEEALAGINRHRYPRNYANLCVAYERVTSRPAPAPRDASASVAGTLVDEPPPTRYDAYGRHVPNQISRRDRVAYLVIALVLLVYGACGVWFDDLILPGRRGREMHFHGPLAWMFYGAMLCACLVMASVIADHYDRRDNEASYRLFADIFKALGWVLFVLSLVFQMFRNA